MIPRQTLLNWCNETLQPQLFKDGAPNGLQVEGNDQIRYIITAVTASQAAINHAVEQGADTLLVHHGLFWRSEPTAIIGWKKQRIAALLAHNINLIGYHLPLDAHPTLGNNAQLAAKLNWQPENTFGEQNLLNIGILPNNQRTLAQLAQAIEQTLGRTPTIIGNPKQPLTRMVHRRRAMVFSGCHRCRRRRVSHRRNLRSAISSCQRNRHSIHRRRAPCHRTLRHPSIR